TALMASEATAKYK
ncbi:hypothetical protein A2U01_0092516, partial [Trifolium medium]|nr:hypothetical protein [Trifolium medium]